MVFIGTQSCVAGNACSSEKYMEDDEAAGTKKATVIVYKCIFELQAGAAVSDFHSLTLHPDGNAPMQ